MRKQLYSKTVYGRWTVMQDGHKRTSKHVYLMCQCDCGTKKLIRRQILENGKSRSCGCRMREVNKKLNTKHGLYYHRIYPTWSGMMNRCYNKGNPAYHNYGGRGISVSKRWHNVKNFVSDMQNSFSEGLTLDRKNNNGNYTKHNCRWATQKEQCNNHRKNVVHAYSGETMTLKQFSEKYDIKYSLLYQRVRSRGWTIDEAIETPRRVNQFA